MGGERENGGKREASRERKMRADLGFDSRWFLAVRWRRNASRRSATVILDDYFPSAFSDLVHLVGSNRSRVLLCSRLSLRLLRFRSVFICFALPVLFNESNDTPSIFDTLPQQYPLSMLVLFSGGGEEGKRRVSIRWSPRDFTLLGSCSVVKMASSSA